MKQYYYAKVYNNQSDIREEMTAVMLKQGCSLIKSVNSLHKILLKDCGGNINMYLHLGADCMIKIRIL